MHQILALFSRSLSEILSAMLNLCTRSCIAFWDTQFVEDSWKMALFLACFASLSPNNGGLPSNDKSNDTAKYHVSGHSAHLLLRM